MLERARGLMGRLPFDQIDLLVVGELGKNYSGAGMDPNVIGRLFVETQPDFDRPVVTRLVVLDVSDESHGNIVGVGFADLTTDRLVSKMDPQSFRINTLTSCCLQRSRIPLTLPTDREVIEAALDTCWRIDPAEARVVVIPNTLELNSLWVSAPLEDEVRAHPHLARETEYLPMPFSARRVARPGRHVSRQRPRTPARVGQAFQPDTVSAGESLSRSRRRLESLTSRSVCLGIEARRAGQGGQRGRRLPQRTDGLARRLAHGFRLVGAGHLGQPALD